MRLSERLLARTRVGARGRPRGRTYQFCSHPCPTHGPRFHGGPVAAQRTPTGAGFPGARPTGFEPVTFGSVGRAGENDDPRRSTTTACIPPHFRAAPGDVSA